MTTEVLVWIAVGLGALLAPTIPRILAEDAKTFIPRKCKALLQRSAAQIHEDLAPALLEEWLAHLDECPELTGKLWHALSIYLWGARRIGAVVGFSAATARSRIRAKRAMDIFFVLSAAPWVLLVVFILIVILLVSGVRNPVVGDWRVGTGGKHFKIWKLNTTAEKYRNPYCSATSATRKLIRRTAMDELPQLWNVFVGEMSIVGPRAYLPGFEPKDPQSGYYSSKPGLTGPWQIAGPHGRSPALRESLDEEYYRRSSVMHDLTILVKTLGIVLREK